LVPALGARRRLRWPSFTWSCERAHCSKEHAQKEDDVTPPQRASKSPAGRGGAPSS
jgi:hypothetical protein